MLPIRRHFRSTLADPQRRALTPSSDEGLRVRLPAWGWGALIGIVTMILLPMIWMITSPAGTHPELRYVVDGRNVRLHPGDDLAWARTDWNDRDWPEAPWDTVAATPGIYWVRFDLDNRILPHPLPNGGRITAARPFQLYWDGLSIAGSGVPGRSRNEERPGQYDTFFSIPPTLLQPGLHVLALRVSGFRDPFRNGSALYFKLDDPANLQAWRAGNALCPTAATGMMSFLTIACAAFWLLALRRPAVAWLTGLCLASTVMEGLLMFRWLHGYAANWHFTFVTAIISASGAVAWCFAGFVFEFFQVPRAKWLLGGLAPLLAYVAHLAPPNRLAECDWMLLATYVVVIGPVTAAALRREPGAWLVVGGILLSAAWFLIPGIQLDYFPQFTPALISIVLALVLRIRVEHREAQKARLTAARLEIELLKKSLQPHFLMNTLTALAQTIEESPAQAVRLIDDLAAEFRMLAAVSAAREVPLGRELELCRAHLRVMRARTDLDWQLVTKNVDESWLVPPAVFLTLIENGFSHQRTRRGATTFSLSADRAIDGIRYTFSSPGEVMLRPDRPDGGTGLRYIRARLDESVPDAWSLTQRIVTNGWETVIELRRPQASEGIA